MKGLIEGKLVHYVLDDGRSAGEHRPAIVTKIWGDDGTCNLTVFTDHRNDYNPGQDGWEGTLWKTSVAYSENKEPRTWHWIEQDA